MTANTRMAVALALACGAASSVSAQVLYDNGPFMTGPTTLSGVAAPTGGQWSECANATGDTATANTTAGYTVTTALRLSDDFIVPSGQSWNVTVVRFPAYVNGGTTLATAATLRIWNGSPLAGGSVIWGDTTTNRLATAVFSDVYRTFNTIVPPVCAGVPTAPTTGRRLQFIDVTVNTTLPAGTYWVDYDETGTTFSPPTTLPGTRQPNPAANALQFNAAWVAITDAGQGVARVPIAQDLVFSVRGTIAGGNTCYANCDNSTNAPCLNVNDFVCFNNAYAAGNSYANCDASTIPPILNVNDFVCFNNTYAAGCGANNCSPH